MDTTVGTTLQLRVFSYSTGLPRSVITPDSLTMTLYDPSNVTVYQDTKPIPFSGVDPTNNNITVSGYLFTLPGNKFSVSTKREAPYLAQVSATFQSAPFGDAVEINVQ